MATQAILRCDVCPPDAAISKDAENTPFIHGDSKYEVDLCAAHQVELLEAQHATERFVTSGRRTSAARKASRSPNRPGRRNSDEVAAVRKWAAENGTQVANRGRIAKDVMDRYQAAMATQSATRAANLTPPVPAPEVAPVPQFVSV